MSKSDLISSGWLNIINTQIQKNTIDDGFIIGKITNLNPLTVDVEGLSLYKNNLYVNPYLLEWDEPVNIETSETGKHTHFIYNIHHPSKLKIGNSVALYGLEWNSEGKTYQKYCLLNVLS